MINKKIILASMVLILLISWISVINGTFSDKESYSEFIKKAEALMQKEIYTDAIEYYKKAIEIYGDISSKLMLARAYETAQMYKSFEQYCISVSNEHSQDKEIVKLLGNYYIKINEKERAIDWYVSKLNNFEDNFEILAELNKLKGVYSKDYDKYDKISIFRNGYAKIELDGLVGIINEAGEIILPPIYNDASIFPMDSDIKYSAVFDGSSYYYADIDGNKKFVSDEILDYIGAMSERGIFAVKIRDKYFYMNSDFKKTKISFDYATAFYENGAAAVKKSDKWGLINKSFENITEFFYDDVIIDELGCTISNGIAFLKKGDKYLMVDSTGKEITNPIFEDAELFASLNSYAAVKIDNKWGFVDSDGNVVIKPKYEQAKSFSCGLAPVAIGNKWGFVDKEQDIIIEPEFDDASSFTSNGTAAVMIDGKWTLIYLKYIP